MFILTPQANFPYFRLRYRYKGARSAAKECITSDNVDKISQRQLKDMLVKEGLL